MIRTLTAVALTLTLGSPIAEAQALRLTLPAHRPMAPIQAFGRASSEPSAHSAPTTASPSTPACPGQLFASVDENGAPAIASVEVRQEERLVASGRSTEPISLPPGRYDVVLTLEDVLDRPSRTVRIDVPEGGSVTARASFATAILEVRFTKNRSAVHGLATVRRNGRVVGTLGSGVTARVSAGAYEIDARYRTETRTHAVELVQGQRRALRADF